MDLSLDDSNGELLKMIDNDDIDVDLEDIELILEQADELAAKGKYVDSLENYEKAAQLYLHTGSYIQIPDIFAKIAILLRKGASIISAIRRLENIINKFRQLDLPEETARLYAILGTIYFQSSDYGNAAENYELAAEWFQKLGPSSALTSGTYLIRAGECWEKDKKTDRGERLVMKALLRFTDVNQDPRETEEKAIQAILAKEFPEAIKYYLELAGFFERALEKSGQIRSLQTMEKLTKNVQARLLHLLGDIYLVPMLCYRAIGDDAQFEAYARKIITALKTAISHLHEIVLNNSWDPEDIRRMTFDLFTLTFIQEVSGIKEFDPFEFALENVDAKKKQLLEEHRFFQYAKEIPKIGVNGIKKDIRDHYMGYLDKVKGVLLTLF